SLEAEYIAFASVGGAVGTFGGVAPVRGIGLPPGLPRIDLAGVTLDTVGPGGPTLGPSRLLAFGRTLGTGNPDNGVNQPIGRGAPGARPRTGTPVREGWRVLPHEGVGLPAADVQRIISRGIATASATRAQIRLPIGVRTRMVFAVADTTGAVLGLYRMPDATFFSIDVAVAKARNGSYYTDPAALQPAHPLPR